MWWSKDKPAVVASARVVQGPGTPPPSKPVHTTPSEWQREVWDFYDNLGEFRQGITWKSNMLSRVRLRAARIDPKQDEPAIVDTGLAHDIVRELGGGVGGQTQLMSDLAVYLDVPGECYLIGETRAETNEWVVRSMEEVRAQHRIYEVQGDDGKWRTLSSNSMVVRVWRPHKRKHSIADAPSRAARGLMRELELLNRKIQAQYLSRLASAGIVMFPDEITFPVRPEFADAPDPFVAEWMEIAAEAIATPGSAASVVPIPMKMPGEYIDKVKHIDFTLKLDDKLVEKRDSALARLAVALDMPTEALLGTGNTNHWTAWLIDEQGVKVHIAPDAEVVCHSLTVGYLHPRLKAEGEDPAEWVVWYDASELVIRPDRSEDAKEVYDRLELSGSALRRETGFEEADRPTDEELHEIILKKAALQPVNTFAAMVELGFDVEAETSPNEPRPEEQTPPEQQKPVEPGPPVQPEPPPPRPTADVTRALVRQAGLMHAMRIEHDGTWSLLHPRDCTDHLFSCPVTHATWRPTVDVRPGGSGVYQCWLNAHGQPIIGERVVNGTVRDMLESTRGNP